MDIEAKRRQELVAQVSSAFICIEECRVSLVGFEEQLKADLVAISRSENEPWVVAFEVKVPSAKWELKNWLRSLRQAADYPNCKLTDDRAGPKKGKIINAAFLYPEPDLSLWSDEDSQFTRFYRDYDIEPLRGAVLFAQHFKVGMASKNPKTQKFTLRLGTDPVWDSSMGFRKKSASLLSRRQIGSLKRAISMDFSD